MPLMRLKSPEAAARWLREWTTGLLRTDSRLVQPGDAFIAWPGHAQDGRRFVQAALDAGAATCLVELDGVDAYNFNDGRVAALPGLKSVTGRIAAEYFEHPTRGALQVVATTGTNGKTSTAWWTAQLLSALGRRCGVVGTLGIGEPGELTYTGLTTPDPVQLQAGFRRMADAGFAACAIEASSIGIVEQRLAGTEIAVALFTNFTQDHLDYHGDMDAYWEAKRRLFDWPGLRAAVVNLDDAKGPALAAELADRLDVWSYAVEGAARLSAEGLHYEAGGLCFTLREAGADALPVRTGLIGDYNVANLLAVIGGLRALDLALADIVAAVPSITPVPGRMQRIGSGTGQPQAVVDYAHTPDALEKALQALRPLAAARGGRLLCVFGCGGNRDAGKRPLMGAIAGRLADAVIVTSDNPRHEPPLAILAQVAAGVGGPCEQIEDRRAAITQALAGADARDVVLIAGKGHEDYQEIAGERRPFSDVLEAQAALARRT